MASISIHILDDDSLLNVFRLYRITLFDEDETEIFREEWVSERWWYKLTHVCQRWRCLILGSASHLDLCLLCTYHTPVADMLAHSPPLPIVVDHLEAYYEKPANSEDEAGILIALLQRSRVRRIRLCVGVSDLQMLIAAIDDELPMLEYLCIVPQIEWNKGWILPSRFQAPHIRYLMLTEFALPIQSLLLTTGTSLVALALNSIDPSTHFGPNNLLQWLSMMHHLQSLEISPNWTWIDFHSPVPENDVNGQPLITTHVTLPNLRSFAFQGQSAYLEALLPHITTPLLEKLYIRPLEQRELSVPHLLQFVITTENLTGWLRSAVLRFTTWDASVELYPDVGAQTYSLCLCIWGSGRDRQGAFPARVLDVLRPVLSEVVHLTLEYQPELARRSNQPDHTYWRKVLGAFGNVKTLSMHNDFVGEVSRSLQFDDGESSADLLPELSKLECYGSGDASDAFAPFIDARKNAGRPLILVPSEHFPFRNKTIRLRIPSPFEKNFLIL